MGFRRPPKSASAVDSTDGAGSAGVIIAGARATWQDGAGGTGYAEATSTGGGGIAGANFALRGDGGGGTDPGLDMFPLGPGPTGGYQGVAKIRGDVIRQDVATDPLVPITALTVTSPPFAPYLAGYRSPSFCKLASGLVVVFGTIKVTSVSFGAGQLIATLPAGCRPASTERFTLTGWGQTWTVDVPASGAINYVSAGSGASVVVGALLSLAGIVFPAEV